MIQTSKMCRTCRIRIIVMRRLRRMGRNRRSTLGRGLQSNLDRRGHQIYAARASKMAMEGEREGVKGIGIQMEVKGDWVERRSRGVWGSEEEG